MTSQFLQVSELHTLHFFEIGPKDGIPIIHLHGGPGSKSKERHATPFEGTNFRVIFFDQRGCGQSTPMGEIEENTTQDLIADMEKIRTHLGIEKWYVAGGSWGSTLALLYAQTHPDRVEGLMLRSIWLARKEDQRVLSHGECGRKEIFPDVWKWYNEYLSEQGATLDTQFSYLLNVVKTGEFEEKQQAVARLSSWDSTGMIATEEPNFIPAETVKEDHILAAKIYLHYAVNNMFIDESQIIKNMSRIAHIPLWVLHGRLDTVCPINQAFDLVEAHGNAKLTIVPGAAHRASDPAMEAMLGPWTTSIAQEVSA